MSQGSLSPERVASLLGELARALRARRFYPAKHPALRDALERAASVWRDGLPSGQEVHLELKHGTLALARGTPLRGPGIDDIARELWLRGVRRLRIHSDLEAKETLALIDVLTADADVQAAAGGFEQALRAAGVRHITTSEIDFGEHLGRARGAESPQSDAAGTEGPGSAEAAAVPQALELGETSKARQTPPQAQPKEQLADPTVELLRLLADLERCDEVSKYNLLSNRIEAAVDALLRAKSCADAYCAVLAYCRHAMDTEGRPTPICREARDRLRRLLDHDALLELVIDRACATSGLSSIHATQVLICVGSAAVPTLLRKRSESNAAVCSQTTSILIAMGEQALPAIVDELSSSQAARRRRAACLLGEMRNPRGVEFLIDCLQDADVTIRREVAKALARIGNQRAVQALIDALAKGPAMAEIAARCLGSTRHLAAVKALADIADRKSGHPDRVRHQAIRSLGRIGKPEAFGMLKQVLDHSSFFFRRGNRSMRVVAAQAIGRIGGQAAHDALADHCRGGDAAVRQACREALNRVTRPRSS